jgi:hypothetical protein
MKRDASSIALDINPVYQNLKLELSRTEVEMASLRQQISEKEAVVAGFKSRVNSAPEIEAELTRLNRDYEVNRAQHTALLQRLESARLSEKAENSGERVRFRIIESPQVPLLPIGPPRGLMMAAVLMAALGAAGVLAFFLNQLRPVFLSRGMLAELTGLPVLGAVSYVPWEEQQSFFRRDPTLVAIAGGGLVVAFFLVVGLAEPAAKFIRMIVG